MHTLAPFRLVQMSKPGTKKLTTVRHQQLKGLMDGTVGLLREGVNQ
jgi:hypothetical protein